MALADIEMANAPGPRLLAEGIAIQPAHPDQLPVTKAPSSFSPGALKRFSRSASSPPGGAAC
jgi:hypothetical protein